MTVSKKRMSLWMLSAARDN